MEVINKEDWLFHYKHRYYWLCIVERFLIILQLTGMIVCATFVMANFVNYELPDFQIGTVQFLQ